MRIIGCGLIFLWISALGLSHKWKLEQRCRQWKSMGLFLRLLQEELQSSMKSSEELLSAVRAHCPDLELLQQYEVMEGSVQQRLQLAAESLSDPMMKEFSLRLAQRLGTASADVQLESFRAMELQCQQESERQHEKISKEGSLALSLGVLGGVAAAILML